MIPTISKAMPRVLFFTGAIVAAAAVAFAQAPGGRGQTQTPKQAAPIDLSGYWVSVVTEDWRWRMVTPAKGDFAGIPFNPEGRRLGNLWDPAKDRTEGAQCKAYGAAAVMRVPGRVHITWENENTLRIDTDAGNQTRLLHFGGTPPASAAPTRQGYSAAQWEGAVRGFGLPRAGLGATREGTEPRSLEVVTTQLLPGYLRKNGAPVSGSASVKEYFDLYPERTGQLWFTVNTIVDDPTYLQEPFVTSTNFKKQADASGWNPQPCSAE
jgi:hypothetical protein